jgi:hypothetical protein
MARFQIQCFGILSSAALLASATAFADVSQILPRNPIYAPPAALSANERLDLTVRLIEHGVTIDRERLRREVLTVERTYSQCEGVDFHLHIGEEQPAPATTLQDRLVRFDHGQVILTQNFFDLFTPWMPTHAPHTIDIHWVDVLETATRDEVSNHQPISILDLGQAYSAISISNLYQDPRPETARTPSLAQLGGNNVLLAAETLRAIEDESPIQLDEQGRPYREYHSSLMAHELGHILLSENDASRGYKDHWCPGADTACPGDNLMTGGGYADRIWLSPSDYRKVIGYSPLPELEKAQCEILKRRIKAL